MPNDPIPIRTFTANEADAMLADVLPLVAAMREDAEALRRLQAPLRDLTERATIAGGIRPTEQERDAHVSACDHERALGQAIEELQSMGVRVKDPERGMLDFPSMREGELIELCWVYGEDRVAFWHALDEGFAGRKPI